MSISAEIKLRTLAAQNASLIAALTWPNPQGVPTFMWFDNQLVQEALGKRSNGFAAVTVQRISAVPRAQVSGNQGGPNQALSLIRFQINCVSYNAEQARQVAAAVTAFMQSISLCDAGEFASPQTGPSQNPNFLLSERAGMLPQLSPPAYVEVQDWRVFNREDLP